MTVTDTLKKVIHPKSSSSSQATSKGAMAGSLSGKTAIITGGSKGIGRSAAERLAKDGANIVINYASDTSAADEVVKLIGADRCLAVQADAGSVSGVQKIVDEAVKKFGTIDIVIPNAGVLPMKDLEHTTEEDFDRTYNVNVKGVYFLVQKAAPHMKEGSSVVLVSTSLCHASAVQPGYLLYNSTKGAIEQMIRVLSKDLGRKKIRVNGVAPGPTATELFLRGKPDEMIKAIGSQSPWARLGQPDEIADVMWFLSSDASRWVSGELIMANGAAFPIS